MQFIATRWLGSFGELRFVIKAKGMKLFNMAVSPALIEKLDSLEKWGKPVIQLLDDYAIDVSSPAPLSLADSLSRASIQTVIDSCMLSVCEQQNYDTNSHRLWTRLADGATFKRNSLLHRKMPSPPSLPSPRGVRRA